MALVAALSLCGNSARAAEVELSGELKQWHAVTLTFSGPASRETADPNPFGDYRLTVTFTQGDRSRRVPGYFAADGDAAESGADAGDRWRVHFVPDTAGSWTWQASFRQGPDVAILDETDAGTPAAFDGARGEFTVGPTDKTGRDFRARGLLRYVGRRYLQFAETGEFFLKGGADSPENFLAYADFDGTLQRRESEAAARKGEAKRAAIHRYEPHVRDWRDGDPKWRDGRGKGIIGALNYLAGQGMNSVYFLTMNVGGDGRDVWPWTSDSERERFDCSKLDQWEIVFSHMDRLGLMLHVVTQEQENDQLLDGGELGRHRKLYYRELVARFGHHLAITWNLGEENTNTTEQRRAFARFLHELDPYDHPVVVHTFPGKYDEVYEPLLGVPFFEGPSLQTNDTHRQTKRWVDRSTEAGRPWMVCLDEIGPAHTGVKPDTDDPGHDAVRKQHLWGHLMAGGAGCEWYFGYRYAHNDLNAEDWRSRARMWQLTRIALEFFQRELPFPEMRHADELTSSSEDYCFAKAGEMFAIYLPNGGSTDIDLGQTTSTFDVLWFNPRQVGELQQGGVASVRGPGEQSVGEPPAEADQDWVAVVRVR